jgi:acetyl-CoA synthetase (ADP-forming)
MGRTLSERESKRLVAEFGVPVVAEHEVRTAAEAARAADEIGLPAVVKLNGTGIAHKTERGLVRLGLSTPAQVQAAADELLGLAQPEDGDVTLLVAPMIGGSRELIAGIHHDAQFGRCVMVGIGGVHAEATADVAFALVPIDEADALEMIEVLAGQPLLGPVRGEAAVDRHAVAAVLEGLSKLAIARPDIEAVDVNPLMITDGRPIAVDALVEVAEAAT